MVFQVRHSLRRHTGCLDSVSVTGLVGLSQLPEGADLILGHQVIRPVTAAVLTIGNEPVDGGDGAIWIHEMLPHDLKELGVKLTDRFLENLPNCADLVDLGWRHGTVQKSPDAAAGEVLPQVGRHVRLIHMRQFLGELEDVNHPGQVLLGFQGLRDSPMQPQLHLAREIPQLQSCEDAPERGHGLHVILGLCLPKSLLHQLPQLGPESLLELRVIVLLQQPLRLEQGVLPALLAGVPPGLDPRQSQLYKAVLRQLIQP
mmetsp:Transcript_30978/g.80384  ORF Transcript_30978/g.80384 Transcript_30978/m.80384 type:complete len:258 (-) Transcript_30978:1628-2401(-)